MAEKLCLKWNDFQEDFSKKIGDFKDDPDFADVTLVCEDGSQVEAHRIILAASSPFFQKLLKRNQHTHPLIYMRKVKSEDLLALIDFLYLGEATVEQENLDSFLLLGADLQLEGLMDQKSGGNFILEEGKSMAKPSQKFEDKIEENFANVEDPINIGTTFVGVKAEKIDIVGKNEEDVSFIGLEHLTETVKSMMQKSLNLEELEKRGQRAYSCKVCGKEGDRKNIKFHVERYHLGKFSVSCDVCSEKSNSSKALRSHIVKYHEQ